MLDIMQNLPKNSKTGRWHVYIYKNGMTSFYLIILANCILLKYTHDNIFQTEKLVLLRYSPNMVIGSSLHSECELYALGN